MRETICLDVETGGINPFKSALCSVTIKVVGKDEMETVYIKPTPNREYNSKAMAVNGLTKDYLIQHGVLEYDAMKKIISFITSRFNVNDFNSKPYCVGHNVLFDIQFINALFQRCGGGLFINYVHYHLLDTMIMANILKISGIINPENLKLVTLYHYLMNKEYDGQHSSDGDVKATENVYLELIKLIKHMNKECVIKDGMYVFEETVLIEE